MAATNDAVTIEAGDLTLSPGAFGFEGPITIPTEDAPFLLIESNAEPMGKLLWEDGKFRFEGDAEESAKVFLDWLGKYVNSYHCPCCPKGAE